MRSALQMLGGIAVAGVVATGSTAFTATGVTLGAGAATGFVGGTVNQTVDGATVASVAYAVVASQITGITIVFNDNNSDGKAVSVAPTGSSFSGDSAHHFSCTSVVAGNNTSTCTVVKSGGAASTGGYDTAGMTDIDITVS